MRRHVDYAKAKI